MSAQVQPKHFHDTLARVAPAAARKTTYPILTHILLTAGGGTLTMRATNLDIEITSSVACDGELAPVCVPADRLQATFARLVERGSATLAINGDKLIVTSGRSRSEMPTLLADAFPDLKAPDVGERLIVAGKDLASLFSSCAFAMGKDETRAYLCGIFMFSGTINGQGEPMLCGVATDAHQLSARQVPAELPANLPSVIVPADAVNVLAKLVASFDEIFIEISETRFTASFGSNQVSAKLIEGRYPDWDRVTPKVSPFVTFERKHLVEAVQTAYAAVKADKSTQGLRISFREDETALSITNSDGTASGADACPHSLIDGTRDFDLGVNPEMFVDVVEAIGTETIELAALDGGSPIVITGAGTTDRKAVVMPMRMRVVTPGATTNASERGAA